MVHVAYPFYRLRTLSNSTMPPSNSKNPTANSTVLTVPCPMVATTLMLSPTSTSAMPQIASGFLPVGYLTHRLTNA